MGRLVLLAVAAAAVTWIAGASGASPSIGAAGEARTSVTAAVGSAALPPPRVTMITDSVGGVLYWATTAREALADGFNFHLDTRACRKLVSLGCYAYEGTPPSALETIREIGPELGPIVIVDVGYNDLADGYAADLDTVMVALAAAGVRHVIWVTLEESQGTWAQINVQIRAAPARWPGLVVADWATAVTGHPDWFADGVHMNELGGAAFSRFLRPFVLEACGPACVPHHPSRRCSPRSSAHAVRCSAGVALTTPRATTSPSSATGVPGAPWHCGSRQRPTVCKACPGCGCGHVLEPAMQSTHPAHGRQPGRSGCETAGGGGPGTPRASNRGNDVEPASHPTVTL